MLHIRSKLSLYTFLICFITFILYVFKFCTSLSSRILICAVYLVRKSKNCLSKFRWLLYNYHTCLHAANEQYAANKHHPNQETPPGQGVINHVPTLLHKVTATVNYNSRHKGAGGGGSFHVPKDFMLNYKFYRNYMICVNCTLHRLWHETPIK